MRGMSGTRVAALVLCALWAHDAAGQGVTGFDPPSGVIQVPATGQSAPVITIHNADTVDALSVDLPALSSFEWAGVAPTGGYCVADVTLPSSGSATVTVDAGSTCILSVAVTPLAAPQPGQSVEENVTLTASGSATRSGSYTLRATASSGGGPAPANDHFAAAEDLSGLGIPTYVAIPHPLLQGVFQPRDTVSVTGTTVGSTREPFEYGTVVNPDGSETPPPNGSVWFRYTSPANGFAGRLGYRVTASPRVFATPLVERPGASWPMPDVRGTDFSPGNTWPPSSLPFVRMEPGHSVWFQVFADVENASGTPVWTDGPFTLELYQAPNEQDSILNAYSITGADNPDGTGRPWTDGFNWFGDGDTYHLTADQPNGPRNMWFTASFDQPGHWTFRVFSEQATRGASTRPLGVRLYRAPSGQRVSDPSELTFVQGTGGSLIPSYAGYPGYPGPVWSSALVDVPVQPGRYYWSVDEGPDGPTFFSLTSSYRAVAPPPPPPPPVVALQSTSAGVIGEGGLHQVQITRTGDLSGTTTVSFAIRGGTATTDDIGLVRGTDHVNGGFATLGAGFGTYSLTFRPGVHYVVLAVESAQDGAVEPDETFVLELLSATGATLGDPSVCLATGTILNDDLPQAVAFQSTNAGAIAEGGLHQIQITRTGDLSGTTTVSFAIRGGTAATDDIGLVRGTDHVNGGVAALGTGFGTYSLTFNPGASSVVVAVASAQDSAVEPDETFVLELLSATGATLGDAFLRVATGTILNDDLPPPSCATDLGGILSVTKGPMRYVWVRQRFEQAITLTNTSTTTIQPPVHVAVALDGLGAHVTMVNASGVTSCATPAGSPYIVFPVSSTIPWGPGVRVTVANLAFTTTQNLPITYTTRVLGGTSR